MLAQKSTEINQYMRNEILCATPGQLLLIVFNEAIRGCQLKNERRVCRAVAQLIDELNFDHSEIAMGLFRLYCYVMDLTKKGDFDQALPFLIELRQTWSNALLQSHN